ncbi:MAG: hypothetical protein PHY09_04365 [Desulfuromonadaceae bacterium]|nr:hypothetical protein [Desulfuromonadaceae bacterium]MDD5105721.1 hypothetical protein [Desulfuromonadaceae bacterium]
MSDQESTRLNLLLFSVGGIHFGVDADQVVEVAGYDGHQADDLFWFHEELAYAAVVEPYLSPMVFSIRTDDARSYRVIIDMMEDVAAFSLDDLQLFPSLLEPFVARGGLWGLLLRNGKMVLLVDFQRFLLHRN